MNYSLLISFLFFALPCTLKNKLLTNTVFSATKIEAPINVNVNFLYTSLNAKKFSVPKMECFSEALNGFYALKSKGIITKNILTLIDFSLPSTAKRLWVIDLATNTVLFNTVVSHGINSGLDLDRKSVV